MAILKLKPDIGAIFKLKIGGQFSYLHTEYGGERGIRTLDTG